MKFGIDIATDGEYANPQKLAEVAFEAEKAGWDGFFLWDVLYTQNKPDVPVIDPWITLAAIATNTQHIRMGAFMTPLARRRPWQVARQTATLDHLSNGRVTFGAGLGYQALDFVPFGEEFDTKVRAEKLDEGLEIVNGLWKGEPFSFSGKHYQLQSVILRPTPVQSPRIPVWVAAGWPRRKPFQRAARWDGVYVMTVNQETNELLTVEEVKEIATYMKSLRQRDDPFDIAINIDLTENLADTTGIIRQYHEVGVSWCIALSPETLDGLEQLIKNGPPKV
jgi:alkanesulfonate monooxygenase SsuD/methylene tetrahydromethanopterin reductase-like flavin-dependent oxidoreductase (luciferase family)